MIVVEIKEVDTSIESFLRRPSGTDPIRSEGIHLTDVIKNLMETSGISKTVSGTLWGSDELELAAEMGFLWEEVLSNVLKERLPCRMGEIKAEGISMSPDGIEISDNGEPILSEYKCVWSSSRRTPDENWKWMAQVKGYCTGLGLNKVHMYILYLNGDWKPPKPQYKEFIIEFTELELKENWEMIVGHARRIGWIK